MIIYRVENNKGKGFYHDGFYGNFPPVQRWYPILRYCSEDATSLFINIIHPKVQSSIQELVYDEDSNFVFGFYSESQLSDWFPKNILDKIELKGGKILKYEIDPKFVIKLNRQCVFDIKKSKLI